MTHVTETQNQILEAFTMKDYADLHTHTIASGHAYGTITEMVHAAALKKLPMLRLCRGAAE